MSGNTHGMSSQGRVTQHSNLCCLELLQTCLCCLCVTLYAQGQRKPLINLVLGYIMDVTWAAAL